MTMFVHASARLARVRREAERRSEKESPRIWARVVPPNARLSSNRKCKGLNSPNRRARAHLRATAAVAANSRWV